MRRVHWDLIRHSSYNRVHGIHEGSVAYFRGFVDRQEGRVEVREKMSSGPWARPKSIRSSDG